jgi:hypothetical protein
MDIENPSYLQDPFSFEAFRSRFNKAHDNAVIASGLFYSDPEGMNAANLVTALVAQIAEGGEIPFFINEKYQLINEGHQAFLEAVFVHGIVDPVIEKIADAAVSNIVFAISLHMGISMERINAATEFYLDNHNFQSC